MVISCDLKGEIHADRKLRDWRKKLLTTFTCIINQVWGRIITTWGGGGGGGGGRIQLLGGGGSIAPPVILLKKALYESNTKFY